MYPSDYKLHSVQSKENCTATSLYVRYDNNGNEQKNVLEKNKPTSRTINWATDGEEEVLICYSLRAEYSKIGGDRIRSLSMAANTVP